LEGTFPLPEAQLDRFLMRLRLGYPSEREENAILLRFEGENPLNSLTAVLSAQELLELKGQVDRIHCDDALREYIVRIIQATRQNPAIELGASPRAALALFKTSRALAAINGRDYVLPDDIKRLAPFILTHRLILSSQTRLRGRSGEALVQEILNTVPVPIEGPRYS